jgi:uncharacterized radical SAM superfamily protein
MIFHSYDDDTKTERSYLANARWNIVLHVVVGFDQRRHQLVPSKGIV